MIRALVAFFIGLLASAAPAQTVPEVLEACFDFVLDVDPKWFDQFPAESKVGAAGDDKISRFIPMDGPIALIEVSHLWLDQGDIITIGTYCGVHVQQSYSDITADFDALIASIERQVGFLSNVVPAREGSLADHHICLEGRDLRVWLVPYSDSTFGDVNWIWIRHMPDFGEGCEL